MDLLRFPICGVHSQPAGNRSERESQCTLFGESAPWKFAVLPPPVLRFSVDLSNLCLHCHAAQVPVTFFKNERRVFIAAPFRVKWYYETFKALQINGKNERTQSSAAIGRFKC